MDAGELMQIGPKELADKLLKRRIMLKETLPGVIRTLEAEEDSLSPKVERLKKSFNDANSKVAAFKEERSIHQSKASGLIPEVKEIRERLNSSGGMISLDPKWKKRKLLEQIEEIEDKIQTSALDHKSERKLLEKRRALISENDKWIRDRKDSNPDMSSYLEKSREMSGLFKKADKSHSRMIEAVSKAQPIYGKLAESSRELKEVKSQLDRARELLSQSDKAIHYWEKRLELGYGDNGPGFPDLLKAMKTVEGGGRSSFAKKAKKKGAISKKVVGGEEE
jgi:uncharacterized coiled-coil DUF342 family protein|tara:strand:- start:3703 stop:4539 length:837 start_codon:yes stop_codon:yes gene_type:complete